MMSNKNNVSDRFNRELTFVLQRSIAFLLGMFLKAHANGRNTVGLNMLRLFAWNHNNVGTCLHLLRIL